jgi:hypothetical protein
MKPIFQPIHCWMMKLKKIKINKIELSEGEIEKGYSIKKNKKRTKSTRVNIPKPWCRSWDWNNPIKKYKA